MTNFTKTEEQFIDYLESICDSQQEIDDLMNNNDLLKINPKNLFQIQKELADLKKEFFEWFKNELEKERLKI